MRDASPELQTSIANETTTLARLWRITRQDGNLLHFTDAVEPITFDGDLYRSDISFTTSAILTSRSAINAQSVTMTLVMDDAGVKENDLRARRYDNAFSEVFIVDYLAPENGALTIFTGNFGVIKLSPSRLASIEIIPTSAVINGKSVGSELYSNTCRASLGDARCKVDIEALKASYTVTSASGGSFVTAELSEAAGHWALGFVKWVTGANAGTTSQVQSSDGGTKSVFLLSAPLNDIEIGDTGLIYPGCDKIATTCRDKFNNMVNMRAEPTVPDGANTGAFKADWAGFGGLSG